MGAPPAPKSGARARARIDSSPLPSEELLRQAAAIVEATDSRGRRFKLARPGVLAQFKIVSIVGERDAQNGVYMGMVMPLLYLQEVIEPGEDEGLVIYFPKDARELDALINMLGEEGVSAIQQKVVEVFGEENPEAAKAAIKK